MGSEGAKITILKRGGGYVKDWGAVSDKNKYVGSCNNLPRLEGELQHN